MPKTTRGIRALATAAAFGAAVLLTIGMAPAGPATTPFSADLPADPVFVAAVVALTVDQGTGHAATDALAAIPAGFGAATGYDPVLIDAMAVAPSGGCSSPVPLPAEFDGPCKAHDLGYDLLRYASANGHSLGPWARRDIDAQLDRRMHESCSDRVGVTSRMQCAVMADVAASAVRINSWRQDEGVPAPESPAPFLIVAASVLTLAVALRVRTSL